MKEGWTALKQKVADRRETATASLVEQAKKVSLLPFTIRPELVGQLGVPILEAIIHLLGDAFKTALGLDQNRSSQRQPAPRLEFFFRPTPPSPTDTFPPLTPQSTY